MALVKLNCNYVYTISEFGSNITFHFVVNSGFWSMRCQKMHRTQAFKTGFSESKCLLSFVFIHSLFFTFDGCRARAHVHWHMHGYINVKCASIYLYLVTAWIWCWSVSIIDKESSDFITKNWWYRRLVNGYVCWEQKQYLICSFLLLIL